MQKLLILLCCFFGFSAVAFTPPPTLKLALMKYNGGGDWYNDVNSLKNLAKFCNDNLRTNFDQGCCMEWLDNNYLGTRQNTNQRYVHALFRLIRYRMPSPSNILHPFYGLFYGNYCWKSIIT